MKIAIIMNKNSYAGREYLNALNKSNINVDIISIGKFPEYNKEEDLRCGGYWNPPSEIELTRRLNVKYFHSLKDNNLLKYLTDFNYDIGIQGGTGIIMNTVINSFKYGILNFHPGDLPKYRGCSAPEWQLYENNKIISTCHLINKGIDSGKIIEKKILDVSLESYELFRASIYPETAKFVVEMINKIKENSEILSYAKPQNEATAIYRKYIGSSKIEELRIRVLENQCF